MSLRVFAADSNPHIDPFLYRQSNNRAEELVALGRGSFITLPDGRRAVQLRLQSEEQKQKSIGRGNLVPFGRVYNPMLHPPSLNYEIPHAGDIGIWRHVRKFIRVSARKIDLTTAPYLSPTRSPRGVTTPHLHGSSSSLDTTSSLAARTA
jgi:hypothetical protein